MNNDMLDAIAIDCGVMLIDDPNELKTIMIPVMFRKKFKLIAEAIVDYHSDGTLYGGEHGRTVDQQKKG